jgi:hypothetical protein
MKLPSHTYLTFYSHQQPEEAQAELQTVVDSVTGIYAAYSMTPYQGWIEKHQGGIYFEVRRLKTYFNRGSHPGAATPIIMGQIRPAFEGSIIWLTIRPRLDLLVMIPLVTLIMALVFVGGIAYVIQFWLRGQLATYEACSAVIGGFGYFWGLVIATRMYRYEVKQAIGFFGAIFDAKEKL